MSNKAIARKRINKDIKEIKNNPLEGIGIAPIDDNLMKYVINMRLMSGPYEGYCIQLLLIFTYNYPTKPPKILIYPNQAIDGQYHHHIFPYDDMIIEDENYGNKEDFKGYKKFCFDLLDNDFMPTNEAKTGWNPSYSISSLLLQVQNFIADPDMDGHIPSKYLIKQLFDSMNTYTNTFSVQNEEGIIIQKTHTWKNPYPEMYFKPKEEKKEENKEEIKEKNKYNDKNVLEQIKENLTCFMLKVNYIDDPDIFLGYPIVRIKKRTRIELFPIPEILTYDGFEAQKSLQQQFIEEYFNFKSANNELYNNWLPVYINKDHYNKNKEKIKNAIAEISEKNIFKAEQILQVFPIILNSMIIGMCKGRTSLSSSFIKCYFQYILLFKKMCQEYKAYYSIYLNDIFNKIKENNYIVNKNIIPDIGNFFMVLLFNKLEINTEILKKIYNCLFEDTIIRQMFWIFHSRDTKENMKNLIFQDKNKNNNKLYLEEFEKNPDFKMNNLNKFNEDIKKINIYKDIIDIISTDKGYISHIFIGKSKAREQAEINIKKSFKRLFQECSKEGKDKLKNIILNNLNFVDYFPQMISKNNELYENYKVHELLKDLSDDTKKEILKTAFEGQKGNKLLIITFFAQKKIEEKGFLDELEKNYGVFLDVDNFIQDMNKKLLEIKSYTDLFEFVGADFYKNKYKDDFELIIESYKKALEKNYIEVIKGNKSQILNNSIYSNSNYFPSYLNNSYIFGINNMGFGINQNMIQNRFNNFDNNEFRRRNIRDRSRSNSRNRRDRNRRSRSRNRRYGRSRSYSRDSRDSRSYSD